MHRRPLPCSSSYLLAPATTSLQQQLPSCIVDHFPAAAATFLHRRPLPCRSSYKSCTNDQLPAAATSSAPAATSSAPAVTSPAPATAFLHQRSLSCTSRYQQPPVLHQQLPVLNQRPPFCTSDHLPAPATTSSESATAFLHQRSPSCTSRYQQPPVLHQQLLVLNQRPPSCTNDHLPAPATTSPEPATIFLHQQIPATTSPEPATTFLHQQTPVPNQRPSSCTSGNQSCTIDHLSNEYQSCTSYPDRLQRRDPASTITIRPRRLFAVRFSDLRFAIIKFGLSKQHPCFVILAEFVVNHLYISKVCRDRYIYLASATLSFPLFSSPLFLYFSLSLARPDRYS